jgi:hypothetical protein
MQFNTSLTLEFSLTFDDYGNHTALWLHVICGGRLIGAELAEAKSEGERWVKDRLPS